MAIEMTKDEKKKNFQRWAMKKFLHRQYEIPGLCHRCPFIKEQKEHSLPPGLHPPLVNGKLPEWATKIKPNHENLNLMDCLCTKMKDRTKTLAKLRLIAKELESFFTDNNLEKLDVDKIWFYHRRLLNIYEEINKLSSINKEFAGCAHIYEEFKLYFYSFHGPPDKFIWSPPNYNLIRSAWAMPRALPVNSTSKSLESFYNKILSLASLLYTRIQLLSINRKTKFNRQGDDYYLKQLKVKEESKEKENITSPGPSLLELSRSAYVADTLRSEEPKESEESKGSEESKESEESKAKEEPQKKEESKAKEESKKDIEDCSGALPVQITSFKSQDEFLDERYDFIFDIAGIGAEKGGYRTRIKKEMKKFDFSLMFGDEEVVFLVSSDDDVKRLESEKVAVNKLYCVTDKYFNQVLSQSKNELKKFKNHDHILLIRFEDKSQENDLLKTCHSQRLNYIKYTPDEIRKLFKKAKGKILTQELLYRQKAIGIADDFNRSKNCPLYNLNDFCFHGKNLKKIILELASHFYYPIRFEYLPDNEETRKEIENKCKGSNGSPVTATPAFENDFNNERRKQFLKKLNYILYFDQKTIQQGFSYEPHKSLLDLLIAQFENMRGSRHKPEHPVDDRNTGNILEHFLHPTTTKKAGGKRIPTSWFVQKDPEKHGTWNAAVITVLVTAIHDWVVDGKRTSEEEIHVSIRNTNDRLRRLGNILYPPDPGTSSKKSPPDLSVDDRQKISIQDFAKALLADRRKK